MERKQADWAKGNRRTEVREEGGRARVAERLGQGKQEEWARGSRRNGQGGAEGPADGPRGAGRVGHGM